MYLYPDKLTIYNNVQKQCKQHTVRERGRVGWGLLPFTTLAITKSIYSLPVLCTHAITITLLMI